MKIKTLLCVLLVSVVFFSRLMAQESQVAGTVKLVIGKAKVIKNASKEKFEAKSGLFLSEGDTIVTEKKSSISLILNNGSEIRINRNTQFIFDFHEQDEEIGRKIKVNQGQIWAKIIPGTKFKIKTPACTTVIKGTELDIKVGQTGETQVLVYDGIVEINNGYGSVTLAKSDKSDKVSVSITQSGKAPGTAAFIEANKIIRWDAVIATAIAKEDLKEVKKTEPVKSGYETEIEKISESIIPEPIVPPIREASPYMPGQ